MYYVTAPDGRLLWCADETDDAVTTSISGESVSEQKYMDASREEFERAAREEAGLGEGEPLGDVYVEDADLEGVAFGSPSGDGKRVGSKRVKAYAPVNPVTELMDELGKNERQSVSWSDLQRIMEMINGER